MNSRKLWIVSLFPQIIKTYLGNGVVSRLMSIQNIEIKVLNPSDFNAKGFKGVDGRPYGGGPGMVMRADVLGKTIEEGIWPNYKKPKADTKVIFTSPEGRTWNNDIAKNLFSPYMNNSNEKFDLIFICGRYEGIDKRFIDLYVDEVYSLGNYVLSGGELAVLSIIDSSSRFIPGTLSNKESLIQESFQIGEDDFDSPKWTRPFEYKGLKVPDVLVSGDHLAIKSFNNSQKPDKRSLK